MWPNLGSARERHPSQWMASNDRSFHPLTNHFNIAHFKRFEPIYRKTFRWSVHFERENLHVTKGYTQSQSVRFPLCLWVADHPHPSSEGWGKNNTANYNITIRLFKYAHIFLNIIVFFKKRPEGETCDQTGYTGVKIDRISGCSNHLPTFALDWIVNWKLCVKLSLIFWMTSMFQHMFKSFSWSLPP